MANIFFTPLVSFKTSFIIANIIKLNTWNLHASFENLLNDPYIPKSTRLSQTGVFALHIEKLCL